MLERSEADHHEVPLLADCSLTASRSFGPKADIVDADLEAANLPFGICALGTSMGPSRDSVGATWICARVGTSVFTEMLGPVGDQTGDIEDRGQDDASKRSAEPVAPAEKDATAEQRQPDSQ